MLKYLSVVALIGTLHAETVSLRPVADTTLFELNPTHNLGGHTDVSVGGIAKTKAAGGAYAARGLLKFAITNIPLGTAISSVTLTLTVSRTPGSGGVSSVFDLRRVLKPWGEGDKTGNMGEEASPLEATWNWRSAPAEGWETPGGAVGSDFAGTPSASLSIDDLGNYTFASTSNLIADVQAWLTNPGTNFGWVLMSQSEKMTQTARRFGSREDANSAPTLVLDYSGPTQELRITSLSITNQDVAIAWTGGSPPYQLQQKLGLIGTDWTNAGEPTMSNNASFSVITNQSFFRIAQVAAAPVVQNTPRPEPSEFLAVFDGIRRAPKHQTPSSKLQRISKSQAPNQGPRDVEVIQDGALRFGAWNLGFGASQPRPSHSTESSEGPTDILERRDFVNEPYFRR